MSLGQLEVCQEPSFLNRGTLTRMMVPERRLEGQGHPWHHGWPCLTPRKIPWKFCGDIFIGSVSEWGVLHGGTWNMLKVPDKRLGGQGHPWYHGWPCLTKRKISWKFYVYIFIRSASRRGVRYGGTWRTLMVPDRILGWQCYLWCHRWPCLTPMKVSWKFLY